MNLKMVKMYKTGLPFSLLLLTLTFKQTMGSVEVEDGVLVLNAKNFDEALHTNKALLVEFYAPWCKHCKRLTPKYAAAAKILAQNNSPAKLAKVDAPANQDLANKMEVESFPTIMYFKNGVRRHYTGNKPETDVIVSWVERRNRAPVTTIQDVHALNRFKSEHKVVVVGVFKNKESTEEKEFVEAAGHLDDQDFAIVRDEDLFKNIGADRTIIMYKQYDEPQTIMEGEITSDRVISWFNANYLPLVTPFEREKSSTIFTSGTGSFVLVVDSADKDGYKERQDIANKVAKDFKEKIVFISIDADIEEHEQVLKYFGVSTTPSFMITKDEGKDFLKYRPDSNTFSAENMQAFVSSYLAGDLQPSTKTEDLPQDWDKAPVKVLVGSNFEAVAMDPSKDVLVEFYAPWCGHCKKLEPIYNELAHKFKDVEGLIVAKIDGTANEVQGVEVKGFPDIRMISRKSNKVSAFEGERTLAGFVQFLAGFGIQEPEEEKAEL